MARTTTGPRYFKSKGGYYVTLNGQRHCLAKGPKADPKVKEKADDAYHLLKLAAKRGDLRDGDNLPSFHILNAYADWFRENRAESTYKNRKAHLQWFSDRFGHVKCRDLTRDHAQRHIDAHPTWGAASQDMFLTTIIACFNWAKKQGHVTKNPFSGMEKPHVGSRARREEDHITDEIHKMLLAEAMPTTRDVLVALEETGARPGELFACDAEHYKPALNALLPSRSKNKRHERHGRKPRTIYLTDDLRPVVERLCREHPSGPLFRNSIGNRWKVDALDNWFEDVRERLKLKGSITPYMYRHRYITRALLRGTPAAKVAALLDTSIATIEKHYAHLDIYGDDLRATANKLGGGVRTSPAAGAGAA